MADVIDYRTADDYTLLSDPYVKQLLVLVEHHPEWEIPLLVAQLPANQYHQKIVLTVEDAKIVFKRLNLSTKSQRQTYAHFNQHGQSLTDLMNIDYQRVDVAALLSDKHVQMLLQIASSHPELSTLQLVEKLPKNLKHAPILTVSQVKLILRQLKLATVEERLQRFGGSEEGTSNQADKQPLAAAIPDILNYVAHRREYKQFQKQQARRQKQVSKETTLHIPSVSLPQPKPVPQPAYVPAFNFTPTEQTTFKQYDRFFFLSARFSLVILGALLFLTGGSLVLDFLFKVQGLLTMIGMFFSFSAFVFGTLFLLYSLKYYLTVAAILSFSRSPGEKEVPKGVLPFFARIFGFSVETEEKGEQSILIPASSLSFDLSKIQLERRPFVSIHVAAYNEKRVIDRFLLAATSIEYENFEIVVADDSNDETVQLLEQWKKHPRVKISHRDNREGYKGGALAQALSVMDKRTEFVLVFDADFIPYPDTIVQFLKYFQAATGTLEFLHPHNDSHIAAVQGYQWHVLNKSENWITRGVRTEYAGSYVMERSGTELYGGLKQISGSVYMIRADVLRQIGWGTSITEDFELTLRLYESGYKVLYTPYIQTPAEAASTIKRLIRQRMRWAEGHSINVKKMFARLLFSPRLTLSEKLEFLYLALYYLQAFLFLVGTLCWFLAEVVFRVRLPFWTEVWGWSLVLTNFFALPLMNLIGLFMEGSEEIDYLGLISFIFLSYIIAPFQAFAAVKGFLEHEEGPWFRTPKTGRITDSFVPGRFYRFVKGVLGKPTPYYATGATNTSFAFLPQQPSGLLAMTQSRTMPIRSAKMRWLGKGIVVFVLIISLLINSLAFNVKPAYAWYSSYGYRKLLTIDHTKVSGTANLSAFPVLVSFTDTALIYDANGDNGHHVRTTQGYDIVFTDTSDNLLAFERESYNNTTGQIVMWVKIDPLHYNSDDTFYMYYGKALDTEHQNANGVWDSNYVGVWHMNDNAANTTVNGSTGNSNNGTSSTNTSNMSYASGQIDRAFDFTSDSIDTTSAGTIKGQTQVTISAWFNGDNLNNNSQQDIYFEPNNSSTSTTRIGLVKWGIGGIGSTNKLLLYGRTNDGDSATVFAQSTVALSNTTWYYVVAVYDSVNDVNHIMVNGVDETNSLSEGTFTSTDPIHVPVIGEQANDSIYWDGRLDEVRVSKTYRSPDWSITEYQNQSNQGTGEGKFIKTLGTEEEVPELSLLLIPIALSAPFVIKRLRKERRLCV